MLLLLIACSPGPIADAADSGAPADSGAADSGDVSDSADTAVASLYGAPPDADVPPPDFTATNMDGAARTQADFNGHPTVLWFYPAASTAG